MKLADYHMHTPLCRHASGEPTEYAAQALAQGLEEIGFSDHNPMAHDDFDDWRMLLSDLPAYIEKVEQARRDHPDLRIKIGLEVDYIPGCEDYIRELWAMHDWDYFIGSVHYIADGFAIDNPNLVLEWQRRDTLEIWTTYFERLARAAESGLFQIIGHADLCKRFRFYPRQDYRHLYERFMEAASRGGVAVELNTAGLRKDCREIYPHPDLLRLAHQKGVPITFGSDSHRPGEVGMNFADAVQLARACGYDHCCRFTKGRRELVPF